MMGLCDNFSTIQGFAFSETNDKLDFVVPSEGCKPVNFLRWVFIDELGVAHFETSSFEGTDEVLPS